MKKLFFVLCLISALGVSSMAQIVINPPSDPPVNNVWRWITFGSYPENQTNIVFTHFNDFLGGYDVSLLPASGETTSYFSLDFNTIQIENLNVSIEAIMNGVLANSVEGPLSANWVSYGNGEDFKHGDLPKLYTEIPFTDTRKTCLGSATLTNDCVPLTNESFVELFVQLDIIDDSGDVCTLTVMYDFTLNGPVFE